MSGRVAAAGRIIGIAVALAVAVTILDLWLLRLPFASYFLESTGGRSFALAERIAGTLALLAAQAALFWAALVSPPAIRRAALVMLALVNLVQYGFVAGAGGVLNVHDITMAAQNVKHWTGMARAAVDWRALIPVILAGIVLEALGAPAPRWPAAWIAALTLTLAVHAAFAANLYLRREVETDQPGPGVPPMSALQALLRTITLYAGDAAVDTWRPWHREEVPPIDGTAPRHHVVIVIDESISARHLSLNGYERPTTPWLAQLAAGGMLTNWGVAAAASTYSDASICALLTGFNAYPDVGHRIFTLPTIFQFAKASGFRTHLLDAEQASRRFGLSWGDLRFVDDWRDARAFGDDPDADLRAARAARQILEQPEGQFVVILKRGDHEPPDANYPASAAVWRSRGGPRSVSQAATDAYDDAIRYNLDGFFKALLDADGQLPRTAGIYTSDHAEALGEDGGQPFVRRLTPAVVTVPLLMFGSDRPSADTGYAASHHNVFATLLDLMHVPSSARRWTYGRSLLAARASDRDPRPVLGGFMFGNRFFFEVRDFDDFSRVLASSEPVATH
jgi:glucan phosphoethanolaminetransferase (alkaline phosphatase superfamily)